MLAYTKMLDSFNPYSPGFSIYLANTQTGQLLKVKASILIHLDFLSILKKIKEIVTEKESFNPYSPGFSIYLEMSRIDRVIEEMLQSLFTWIFYLFMDKYMHKMNGIKASILIHLDFLSIQITGIQQAMWAESFNPYSPGFSIYLQ